IGLALTYPTLLERQPEQESPSPSQFANQPLVRVGRYLILATAVTLMTAGLVISIVSMTVVFVPQDLQYLDATPAQLQTISPRLIPLIAHHRAGFGATLLNTGLLTLMCTLFAPLSRHLRQ